MGNRARAAKRIGDALDRQQQIQADKFEAYQLKQAQVMARNEEKRQEKAEATAKSIVTQQEQEKLRKQRLEDAKTNLEERKRNIVESRQAREEKAELIHEEKFKAAQERMLHADLWKEDKIQNVQRIRRVEEFNRLQTLQKIQEDDDRSERIKGEKAFVSQQQKTSAHEAFIRKQRVKDAMNEMRVTNKFTNIESLFGGEKKKRVDRDALESANGATKP